MVAAQRHAIPATITRALRNATEGVPYIRIVDSGIDVPLSKQNEPERRASLRLGFEIELRADRRGWPREIENLSSGGSIA